MTNNRDAFLAGILGFVIVTSFQLIWAPHAQDSRRAIVEMFIDA